MPFIIPSPQPKPQSSSSMAGGPAENVPWLRQFMLQLGVVQPSPMNPAEQRPAMAGQLQSMVNPIGLGTVFAATDPKMVKALLEMAKMRGPIADAAVAASQSGMSNITMRGGGADAVLGLAKGRGWETLLHELTHVAQGVKGVSIRGSELETLASELGAWIPVIKAGGPEAKQAMAEAMKKLATYVGSTPSMFKRAKDIINVSGRTVARVVPKAGEPVGRAVGSMETQVIAKQLLSTALRDPERFWNMMSRILNKPAVTEHAGLQVPAETLRWLQDAVTKLQQTGTGRFGPSDITAALSKLPMSDVLKGLLTPGR